MASRLVHFRPTARLRWLSTATEMATATATATATTATTAVTQDTATAVTKDKPNISLFRKLKELNIGPGSDANVSVVLDEWANESQAKRFDAARQINFLRSRKHYHLALQLSEWLESSKIEMNNADRAVQIDLLAKAKGIASAEVYFDGLQGSAKTNKTYGALLNCYCKEKMLDKAVQLFAKMKELNFTSTLNYNNVMSLYLSSNQPEQVPLLVQELEQNKLKADKYTCNLLINSYASSNDINAAEKVLEKMKKDKVKYDWFTYGNLATIYVNAGLLPKAKEMIGEMEKFENVRDREFFHMLINLYELMSDLAGVNHVWNSLKSVFPSPSNTSYLIMLLALFKLGDLENLEKYFREWESQCSLYDVRLFNVVLESYLNRNMIGEANALYESMVTKGIDPTLATLNIFTIYHIKNDQIDSALKYLEMGACKTIPEEHRWFPTDETVKLFLEYFEKKNDATRAEKFCNSMKKIGRLDSAVYASLLSKS
ncbi:pentatricopeptide repeat-containing protein At4g01990, mitochondrial-like [Coffea arabica]|uniref:Pentatricopeptide repeat-containing protein At4g01990, mitochondrial-like n=1 Tax=Coffea arabica TaxID=13443 RepID=A0A6P6W172_COFAR|nr:pentatricopeptide repeat-containing protein At4g01990, mitochondrial-like [Coffea arabica]